MKNALQDLSSPNWRSRQRAIATLTSSGGSHLAENLVNLARDQSHDLGALNASLQVLRTLDPAVVEHLRPLLQHRLSEVRIGAALVLGQLPFGVGASLLMGLLHEEDPNLVYHAVEGLGLQECKRSVPALLALATGSDLFLAFVAVEALGRIGDRGVVPELTVLLQQPALAVVCAEALGRLAHKVAVPALLQAMQGADRVEPFLLSLESIYEKSGRSLNSVTQRHLAPRIADRLHSTLLHPDVEIQLLAAETLTQAHDSRALPLLCALLASADPGRACRAARALGVLGDAQALPALLSQLGHTHALVRQAIVAAGLLLEVEVSMLMPHLESREPRARATAARWLGVLGQPEALPPLLKRLQLESDVRTRCRTLEAVTLLGPADPLVIACLKQSLLAGSPAEKAMVARLLRGLKREDAEPLLRIALANSDLWTLINGCRSLSGLLESDGGVCRELSDLLRAKLQDPRPPARAEVARAISFLDQSMALELLPALLEDPELDVAAAAVAGLGRTGRSLAKIMDLASHGRLRLAAVAALSCDPQGEARETLLQALEDPEAIEVAIEALATSSDPQAPMALLERCSGLGPWARGALDSLGRSSRDLTPDIEALLLRQPSQETLIEALDLLRRQTNPAARTHLERMLEDSSSWIRRLAILGLCDHCPASEIAAVVEGALLDPDPGVRLTARLVLAL